MNAEYSEALRKHARWQILWHRLQAMRAEPPPTREEAEQIYASLPKRRPGESTVDWIGRITAQWKVLAEFEQWAAKGEVEFTRPLPEIPISSRDGLFNLIVEQDGPELVLRVEALNTAASDYAGCLVALADQPDGSGWLQPLQLDQYGDGEIRIEDGEDIRLILEHPWILVSNKQNGQ